MENRSIITKKVKDKSSWRVVRHSEENLDELTKSIQDYNIANQQTKDDYEVAITTIKEK